MLDVVMIKATAGRSRNLTCGDGLLVAIAAQSEERRETFAAPDSNERRMINVPDEQTLSTDFVKRYGR
jgi:hypothetical protein